jgi:hypothetical protein
MQSDSRLTPGETYNFTLREGRVRSVWGDTLPDTTITRIFSMRPEDEFGSLSGITAMGSNFVENTFLFLRPIGGRAQSRYFRPAPDSTFQVAWLPEGKYILGGFIDLDQDNKYSPGNLYPFKYSEPYYVQPDTIHIRKRWEVSDFTYSIPALDTK